jgi:hypothetical protein
MFAVHRGQSIHLRLMHTLTSVCSSLWSFSPFKGGNWIHEVLSDLLRTFGRAKGKDYVVRKRMYVAFKGISSIVLVGTRPGLAVTSLNARVKAEKEHRKDMVAAASCRGRKHNAMRAVIRELFEEEEDSAFHRVLLLLLLEIDIV